MAIFDYSKIGLAFILLSSCCRSNLAFIPQEPSNRSFYNEIPSCSEFLQDVRIRRKHTLHKLFHVLQSSTRTTKDLSCSLCVLDFKENLVSNGEEFRRMLLTVENISNTLKNLSYQGVQPFEPPDKTNNQILMNALIMHDILELKLFEGHKERVKLSLIDIRSSKKPCSYFLEQKEWEDRLHKKKQRADLISKLTLVSIFNLFISLLATLFFMNFKQVSVDSSQAFEHDDQNEEFYDDVHDYDALSGVESPIEANRVEGIAVATAAAAARRDSHPYSRDSADGSHYCGIGCNENHRDLKGDKANRKLPKYSIEPESKSQMKKDLKKLNRIEKLPNVPDSIQSGNKSGSFLNSSGKLQKKAQKEELNADIRDQHRKDTQYILLDNLDDGHLDQFEHIVSIKEQPIDNSVASESKLTGEKSTMKHETPQEAYNKYMNKLELLNNLRKKL